MSDFENSNPIPEEHPEGASTPTEEPAEGSQPVCETPVTETEGSGTPVTETEGSETPVTAAAEAPKTVYRWTYADETAHGKPKKSRGMVVYAAVMSAVFLLSFGLLIAVLLLDDNGGNLLRPGVTDEYDEDEAVAGVEQAKHSVVVIEVKTKTGGGTGTGIVMTSNGYIATNHHVIEGATKIKVTFYDGTVLYAEAVGSSEMDDLAVIKVGTTGLIPATFAYSDDCYVGQTVYAIATPAGPDFAWTTTKGIISYKDREVKIYDDTDGTLQKKLRLLQTDAMVNPGNSGGPLVNTKGEVLGVVSMKLAEGYEGIGFAIPSDGAVEILEAIMTYGNADSINSSLSHKRPMLGITGVYLEKETYYLPSEDGMKMIPADKVELFDRSELIYTSVSGVYIMSFTEGMDAAAKLQKGDIITAVQGEDIESMDSLTGIINDYYAGDTVTLTVYRSGSFISVDIVLSPKQN